MRRAKAKVRRMRRAKARVTRDGMAQRFDGEVVD